MEWGSTGDEDHLIETQTVERGGDAVLPTKDTGLPGTIESTDGKTLFFAYWDGEYTNIEEDQDVYAVYTPLVTLITYCKTGYDPDVPATTEVPLLCTPELELPETPEDGYSKAWFMTWEGEWISDTPFEYPCLEDPEMNEYEFTYCRYTDLTFKLDVDGETYTRTCTLLCPTYIGEGGELCYRYLLAIQFSPEEPAMDFVDLQGADAMIMFEEEYGVGLDQFRYRVASGGDESDPLDFEILVSMLENSGDEPLLITGAEAVWTNIEDDSSDSGEESSDSGEESSDSGEESSDSGEESSDSGEGSSDSGEESSDSGEESSDSGEGSSDSGEESSDSGEESSDSGEGSSDSGDGSSTVHSF